MHAHFASVGFLSFSCHHHELHTDSLRRAERDVIHGNGHAVSGAEIDETPRTMPAAEGQLEFVRGGSLNRANDSSF